MKTLLHITIRANGAKPVESGRRATAKGYSNLHSIIHERVTGVWKHKNNFTALFFPDGRHMTWAYGKGPVFPHGVTEGDQGEVVVVGRYSDADVACKIVTFGDHTHQP